MAASPEPVSPTDFQHIAKPVGAAAGCDLLTLMFKNQKIAAYGSSYSSGDLKGVFRQVLTVVARKLGG
ncbi:hypothetical protein EMIT0P260_80236 [Pseudomonas sp. IT-P260]